MLFLLPILDMFLAYLMKEVEMYQSGAIYALLVEAFILGFFMVLGLLIMLKFIK